jgi:hypothetical protein
VQYSGTVAESVIYGYEGLYLDPMLSYVYVLLPFVRCFYDFYVLFVRIIQAIVCVFMAERN